MDFTPKSLHANNTKWEDIPLHFILKNENKEIKKKKIIMILTGRKTQIQNLQVSG